MAVYATITDLADRFPNELTLIAADEQTGVRDDSRIEKGLLDASIEVRAILAARYASAELAALDADSLDVLRLYTMDIAFHRIALAFSRSSENIKERYDQALKRLEAIAAGKGALTTTLSGTGSSQNDAGDVGQNEVILEAPERMFTRERLGRI